MQIGTSAEPPIDINSAKGSIVSDNLATRIRVNQQKLFAELKPHYDFIVCGSGSSGSVVARRLAENADVNVLLLEAGGSDDVASIKDASAWPSLRGGEHDWAFRAKPNPRLKGRAIPMAMGKVLGGGSSINVMVWSRGHKKDWDHFAAEAGDEGWNRVNDLRLHVRVDRIVSYVNLHVINIDYAWICCLAVKIGLAMDCIESESCQNPA
jgi:choline dehydrogenase